ncbi:MAG: preprotein translocase subunit SecE [Tannerella sp.]|nr:preprotein translocase subunit SecE [Tannerella sp.]
MKKFFYKIGKYFKESYNELVYKVSWPSKTELSNSAVVVLFASIVIALIVFAIDFVFKHAIEFIYDTI